MTPASVSSNAFPYPGTTPSISANGTQNAILWAAENSSPAVLHAYDATNLAVELYNSNQAVNGIDHFGSGNKYIVPTVANGKVYVGTTNGVGVFGLRCSYSLMPTHVAIETSYPKKNRNQTAPIREKGTAKSTMPVLIQDRVFIKSKNAIKNNVIGTTTIRRFLTRSIFSY